MIRVTPLGALAPSSWLHHAAEGYAPQVTRTVACLPMGMSVATANNGRDVSTAVVVSVVSSRFAASDAESMEDSSASSVATFLHLDYITASSSSSASASMVVRLRNADADGDAPSSTTQQGAPARLPPLRPPTPSVCYAHFPSTLLSGSLGPQAFASAAAARGHVAVHLSGTVVVCFAPFRVVTAAASLADGGLRGKNATTGKASSVSSSSLGDAYIDVFAFVYAHDTEEDDTSDGSSWTHTRVSLLGPGGPLARWQAAIQLQPASPPSVAGSVALTLQCEPLLPSSSSPQNGSGRLLVSLRAARESSPIDNSTTAKTKASKEATITNKSAAPEDTAALLVAILDVSAAGVGSRPAGPKKPPQSHDGAGDVSVSLCELLVFESTLEKKKKPEDTVSGTRNTSGVCLLWQASLPASASSPPQPSPPVSSSSSFLCLLLPQMPTGGSGASKDSHRGPRWSTVAPIFDEQTNTCALLVTEEEEEEDGAGRSNGATNGQWRLSWWRVTFERPSSGTAAVEAMAVDAARWHLFTSSSSNTSTRNVPCWLVPLHEGSPKAAPAATFVRQAVSGSSLACRVLLAHPHLQPSIVTVPMPEDTDEEEEAADGERDAQADAVPSSPAAAASPLTLLLVPRLDMGAPAGAALTTRGSLAIGVSFSKQSREATHGNASGSHSHPPFGVPSLSVISILPRLAATQPNAADGSSSPHGLLARLVQPLPRPSVMTAEHVMRCLYSHHHHRSSSSSSSSNSNSPLATLIELDAMRFTPHGGSDDDEDDERDEETALGFSKRSHAIANAMDEALMHLLSEHPPTSSSGESSSGLDLFQPSASPAASPRHVQALLWQWLCLTPPVARPLLDDFLCRQAAGDDAIGAATQQQQQRWWWIAAMDVRRLRVVLDAAPLGLSSCALQRVLRDIGLLPPQPDNARPTKTTTSMTAAENTLHVILAYAAFHEMLPHQKQGQAPSNGLCFAPLGQLDDDDEAGLLSNTLRQVLVHLPLRSLVASTPFALLSVEQWFRVLATVLRGLLSPLSPASSASAAAAASEGEAATLRLRHVLVLLKRNGSSAVASNSNDDNDETARTARSPPPEPLASLSATLVRDMLLAANSSLQSLADDLFAPHSGVSSSTASGSAGFLQELFRHTTMDDAWSVLKTVALDYAQTRCATIPTTDHQRRLAVAQHYAALLLDIVAKMMALPPTQRQNANDGGDGDAEVSIGIDAAPIESAVAAMALMARAADDVHDVFAVAASYAYDDDADVSAFGPAAAEDASHGSSEGSFERVLHGEAFTLGVLQLLAAAADAHAAGGGGGASTDGGIFLSAVHRTIQDLATNAAFSAPQGGVAGLFAQLVSLRRFAGQQQQQQQLQLQPRVSHHRRQREAGSTNAPPRSTRAVLAGVSHAKLLTIAALLDWHRTRHAVDAANEISDTRVHDAALLAISHLLSFTLDSLAELATEVRAQLPSDTASGGDSASCATILWEPILTDVFERCHMVMDAVTRSCGDAEEEEAVVDSAAEAWRRLVARTLHFAVMSAAVLLVASAPSISQTEGTLQDDEPRKSDDESTDAEAGASSFASKLLESSTVVASLGAAWAACVADTALLCDSTDVAAMVAATVRSWQRASHGRPPSRVVSPSQPPTKQQQHLLQFLPFTLQVYRYTVYMLHERRCQQEEEEDEEEAGKRGTAMGPGMARLLQRGAAGGQQQLRATTQVLVDAAGDGKAALLGNLSKLLQLPAVSASSSSSAAAAVDTNEPPQSVPAAPAVPPPAAASGGSGMMFSALREGFRQVVLARPAATTAPSSATVTPAVTPLLSNVTAMPPAPTAAAAPAPLAPSASSGDFAVDGEDADDDHTASTAPGVAPPFQESVTQQQKPHQEEAASTWGAIEDDDSDAGWLAAVAADASSSSASSFEEPADDDAAAAGTAAVDANHQPTKDEDDAPSRASTLPLPTPSPLPASSSLPSADAALCDAETAERRLLSNAHDAALWQDLSMAQEVPERYTLAFRRTGLHSYASLTLQTFRAFCSAAVVPQHGAMLQGLRAEQLVGLEELARQRQVDDLSRVHAFLQTALYSSSAAPDGDGDAARPPPSLSTRLHTLLAARDAELHHLLAWHGLVVDEDEERTLVVADAVCGFDILMEHYYDSEADAMASDWQRHLAALALEMERLLLEKREDALQGLVSALLRSKRLYGEGVVLPALALLVRHCKAQWETRQCQADAVATHAAFSALLLSETAQSVARLSCQTLEAQHRYAIGKVALQCTVQLAASGGWLGAAMQVAERLAWEARHEGFVLSRDFASASYTSMHLKAVRASLVQHKSMLRGIALERDEDKARWQILQFALVVEYPSSWTAYVAALPPAAAPSVVRRLDNGEEEIAADGGVPPPPQDSSGGARSLHPEATAPPPPALVPSTPDNVATCSLDACYLRPLSAKEARGRGDIALGERLVRARMAALCFATL